MPCVECKDARRCETVCQASIPWVPLTSEEIWQAIEDVPITKDYVEGVARAVERAVWAKNGPRDVKEASVIQCTQCLAVTNEGNGCAQEGCPVGVRASHTVDDLMELARQYAHAYFNHHTGSSPSGDTMLDKTRGALRAALSRDVRGWSDEQIVEHLDAHGVAFAFHPTALIAAIRALPHGVAVRYEGRCISEGESSWEPLTKVEYDWRKKDHQWEVREVPIDGVPGLDGSRTE